MGSEEPHFRLRLTGRQDALIQQQFETGRPSEVLLALCGTTSAEEEGQLSIVLSVHEIYPTPIPQGTGHTEELKLWLAEDPIRQDLIPLVVSFSSESPGSRTTSNPLKLPGGLACMSFHKGRYDMGQITWIDGQVHPIVMVSVSGSDIRVFDLREPLSEESFLDSTVRIEQAFGVRTRKNLSRLKIGVVGISGTGSPLCEMLFRLGIRELVLVDDDHVGVENLDRIFNATLEDVEQKRFKVDLTKEALEKVDPTRRISALRNRLPDREAIQALAQCDVLFGCMDKHTGRNILNRLSNFYSIPYFDVGVKLRADGYGGVSEVCGAVHYLQPDGSTLISRKVINYEKITVEGYRASSPEMHDKLVEEKYIVGAQESNPAVISINTMVASLALNDFLARLHPYRNSPNSDMESISINLCELDFTLGHESDPPTDVGMCLGIGDIEPPLGMPSPAK